MARPHPASKAGTNFLQPSGMLGSVLASRGSAPPWLLPRWEAQREERMCGLLHVLGEPAGQLVSAHPSWPADPSSLRHIYLLFPQAAARCWDALSFNSLLPAGQLEQRGPRCWPCRVGAPWWPRACALRGHKPWCVGTPRLLWLSAACRARSPPCCIEATCCEAAPRAGGAAWEGVTPSAGCRLLASSAGEQRGGAAGAPPPTGGDFPLHLFRFPSGPHL